MLFIAVESENEPGGEPRVTVLRIQHVHILGTGTHQQRPRPHAEAPRITTRR
jgi:pyrimidine deaminase RibD-like protein